MALFAFLFLYAGYFIVGASLIVVFDAPEWFTDIVGILVPASVLGHYGNRLSARNYVKNG